MPLQLHLGAATPLTAKLPPTLGPHALRAAAEDFRQVAAGVLEVAVAAPVPGVELARVALRVIGPAAELALLDAVTDRFFAIQHPKVLSVQFPYRSGRRRSSWAV